MSQNTPQKCILIVEDEEDLAKTLAYNLKREGYLPKIAYTGESALERVSESPIPDMVLLDLMLPDMSGLEICRKLRQSEETRGLPIVMLTAKGEEIDRVVGFEVGADDYVVKPFSVRELMLRIKALFRRTESLQAKDKDEPQETLVEFGTLRLDIPGYRVWQNEEEIKLTVLEFNLLKTLLARKGRVQSRETLLNDVWGIKADITTRTVDTHVKRLREKLGSAGSYIETLRGLGYRFTEEPKS